MTAGENQRREHAFEQLSHLWSAPRFLFFPFAIGMGAAASEEKLPVLVALSADSSLSVWGKLPCAGALTRASEAEPREAEIWWVEGGGDEERDKEANDNAAAVGGLGYESARLPQGRK